MKRLRFILLSFIFSLIFSYVSAQSFVSPMIMHCDSPGLYVDSGTAYLYLVNAATNMMTLVQTKTADQWSPLEFIVNTAGFYILLIVPHPDYPPCQDTWNDSALFWEDANMYSLDGITNSWNPFIIMQSLPAQGGGTAMISGKIVAGNVGKVGGPGDPFENVGMSLVNSGSGSVVGFTMTDMNGEFNFNNVDIGMYNLNANVAGISSDINFVIDITTAAQIEDSIVGTVDSTGITFKYDVDSGVGILNYSISASSLQLYPNPAAGGSHLSYSLNQGSTVTLRVYNLLGVLVEELQNGNKPAGSHQSYFEAASGTYFVELQVNGESTVRRLIMTR